MLVSSPDSLSARPILTAMVASGWATVLDNLRDALTTVNARAFGGVQLNVELDTRQPVI